MAYGQEESEVISSPPDLHDEGIGFTYLQDLSGTYIKDLYKVKKNLSILDINIYPSQNSRFKTA